ncbi:uncharacterized protein yc1106_02548 [Curvularia clavata]|uniref:Hepatocellular carcinoma-associated antigen 59-domain-containing protein n=1 Tax=Curvularia clavata TaxID=95742 RepID=A0A9Q8Z5J7_CURCL|nr:uncharacterized protein yc1106_02548 [Curvularia clavata]
MATTQEESSGSAIRFKRRKTAYPKRVAAEEDASTVSTSQPPDASNAQHAPSPANEANDAEESVPNLKEILRNRKRPRDRLKESARKTDSPRTELVHTDDTPRADQYTGRFVAQTGQVVDRDDKQMSEYVEARMAEKNHRQYGWPIPTHLQAAVAAIAPDLKNTFVSSRSAAHAQPEPENAVDKEHSERLAAGQGKLQEVDLGPEATARIEQAWKQLDKGEPEVSTTKTRKDRYGYAWRKPRAGGKTEEDRKRDQMVEAVLSEAKLDYFDAPTPSNPPPNANDANTNADDALVEQFRTEYLEYMEARRQHQAARKTTPSTAKGAAPSISGPKMGGSKSARARMHKLQQEEMAKKKR